MRILLVVMIGFILAACGQDYEEVYGIKVGVPLTETNNFSDYVEDKESYHEINGAPATTFYRDNKEGLFSSIEILEAGGVVNTVFLLNPDIVISDEDMSELISKLENRWGELEKYEKGWVILSPKSNIINYIDVYYSNSYLFLTYGVTKPEVTFYDIYNKKTETPIEYVKKTFNSL